MKDAVEKRLEEGKTLEEIGQDICSGVKSSKRKIIRIVKEIEGKGEQYLIDNSEKLGYDGVGQLKSAKKKVQKIAVQVPEQEQESTESVEKTFDEQLFELLEKLRAEYPNDWEEKVQKYIAEYRETVLSSTKTGDN
jgi:translation elongation factor EF-G